MYCSSTHRKIIIKNEKSEAYLGEGKLKVKPLWPCFLTDCHVINVFELDMYCSSTYQNVRIKNEDQRRIQGKENVKFYFIQVLYCLEHNIRQVWYDLL